MQAASLRSSVRAKSTVTRSAVTRSTVTICNSYVVVTGGVRGLGKAVCKKLASLNKQVVLTSRQLDEGEAAAELLGPSCRFFPLDTSDPASIIRFSATLHQEMPGQQIELLVNNAGIMEKEWTQENFDTTIDTNAKGPVALIRALEAQMHKNALIINVSSGLGRKIYVKDEEYRNKIHTATSADDLVMSLTYKADTPQAGLTWNSYSVSKAALSKATTLMSEEPSFKRRGISMVSVCPGWCRTDMGSAAASRSPEEGADSILWPLMNFTQQLNGAYLDDQGVAFDDQEA